MNTRKNDQSFINREAKKLKAISILGGSCIECGEKNHIFLDFHHELMEDKNIEMGQLWSKNWNAILVELKKCQLLCCKCHRIKHYDIKRFSRLKKEILLKIDQVEFNSRNRLTNHEKENIDKLYNNGTKNYKKISNLLNISSSLVKHHLFKTGSYIKGKNKDIELFYRNNLENIILMYKNNITLIKILKELKSDSSVTSLENFIKKLIREGKIEKRQSIIHGKIIEDEKLIELHNSGKSIKSISLIYNVNPQTVRKRLRKLKIKGLIDLKTSTRKIYE